MNNFSLKLARKNTIYNNTSAVAYRQQEQSASLMNQLLRASSTAANANQSTSAPSFAYGKHWTIERYLAVGLLAIIPTSILLENTVTDYILAISLIIHANWGLQAIVTDYVHGPTMPKVASSLVYLVSGLALVGLLYFNYADIGISKAIKKMWSL
jgi:succinate dehydrogenase (ubiquinone) membrane anchor subunit